MSDYKQPLSLSDSVAHLPAAKGLTMEDRVGINEMKTQLEALWPKYSDVIKNLTPSVRKQVEALRGIESQHKELEAKFHEERAALEARYYKLYSPLYSKRYHIVNGIGVVGEAEEDANDKTDDTAEKGVPKFWLTAMKNNEITADEISKRDEEALKYLKDIKWVRMDEPNSFKLEFFFEKNPFFKNSLLTKEYFLSGDIRHPDLVHLAGTTIEWLPGKCLTQKVLVKKPKMGSKNAKPITKTEDCESFFNFFSPVLTAEEMDEDTAEDIKNQMSHDYVIGSTIKEEIIPHPVSWYTGEANEDFRGCAEKLYMLSLACGQTREGLLRALVTKGP